MTSYIPKLKSLTFWGFEKWEEWIGIGEEEEEDNGFVTNTIIIMPRLHSLTIEIRTKGFSINRSFCSIDRNDEENNPGVFG